MSILEDAILIALQAHKGQRDKAGDPYILHPLRMMCRMHNETERIAAVLHDVIEDSSWTAEKLREAGFSEEIIAIVDGLTRREGESYHAFIRRTEKNHVSKEVKIADLEDNMDIRRLARITESDRERLNRYLRAWRFLTGKK
ncbi:MAG: HD domain-containing protein [Deltaproteobacteria bacterium]|nr:HD domain-containing protein [Deltaproteobacteria bacterium]